MTTPADAMAAALPQPTAYPRGSRYHGIPAAIHTTDGQQLPYLTRRLLPATQDTAIAEHVVSQGDRLDLIAHRYYGDAGAWWRIADANPHGLALEPGLLLRITMPNA